jgi:protein-tyrosine-phosphatase
MFACTRNAIRSPMAAALLRALHGTRIHVASCGIKPSELDPFAVAVMREIGIDISLHEPKSFADLDDSNIDLIVSLSPEAQHRAVEMTRTMACDVELWKTMDPTLVEGSREARLEAYRALRESLRRRIRERFPPAGSLAV